MTKKAKGNESKREENFSTKKGVLLLSDFYSCYLYHLYNLAPLIC